MGELMDEHLCPHCSCDAASLLGFKTDDGRFVAAIQCHVCGYEKPTHEGFEDEQAAREAAKREWFRTV